MKIVFSNKGNIFLALICIILGSLILLKNLNYFGSHTLECLISWESLFILVGLRLLWKRRFISGSILAGGGVFFLIPKIFYYYELWYDTYWPVLLIIVGLGFALKNLFPRNKDIYDEYEEINDGESK